MDNGYRKRILDNILKFKLESKGAVLIRGPKWCGKTTTAEQFAKSVLYMSQPQHIKRNLELAQLNPLLLLEGEKPRLIDEWQLAPQIWDSVRFEVDHQRKRGLFILTGSAMPVERTKGDLPLIYHSGTGRFAILEMLPMTLFESGDSTGEVSLNQLFEVPDQISGHSLNDLRHIAYLMCRGGWPYAVAEDLSKEASLEQAKDYVDIIVEEDISRVDGVERNVERARRLLRSYSRLQGTQTAISQIHDDLRTSDSDSLSDDTIRSYLNALRQIFVIKDLESWNPNLRSKAAIRSTPTRYFTDPSIATASLRIGPDELLKDLNTMGLIFETLCVRDLRVYARALDGDVYHYRDSNGLECDAVVHLRNGNYGLIEIKLGGDRLIEEGCANLSKLEKILDYSKMNKPSFKMVLTAVGEYAYRRADGIYIVPITTLKD
ncbi:MAG: ATP-binding protein [Bacteroidales bacterium]|nr:ATP-binding protein [Bacteroidales bacterium]